MYIHRHPAASLISLPVSCHSVLYTGRNSGRILDYWLVPRLLRVTTAYFGYAPLNLSMGLAVQLIAISPAPDYGRQQERYTSRIRNSLLGMCTESAAKFQTDKGHQGSFQTSTGDRRLFCDTLQVVAFIQPD